MAKIKTCKHIFKHLSLALVGLATICVAVGYAINTINKNIRDVNAEGGTTTAFIEVNPDGEGEPDYDDDYPYYYHYIDPETGLPWYTHRFFIEPEEGGGVNGFCAQPSVIDYPEGNVTGQVLPDTETNRLVKLMAYIASYDNSSNIALRSELFSWLPSDFRNTGGYYTYAHATIGYLFNNGDTTGLSESDIANITGQNGVIAKLQSMINDADDPYHNIWLTVQPYELYGTVNDSGGNIQTVIWVQEAEPEPEPEYGSIIVHKCDIEQEPICNVNATSHQASGGGSLAGITFTVYDNNNTAITTATTNNNGIATFSNLPVGVNYTVRETATNNSYLLNTEPQYVTNLTTSGAKVAISDCVKRADIKFVKVDESGIPMGNVAFAITSNTTGERHVVVTDDDGVVNTASYYTLHSTDTNGYDGITDGNYIHQNYGTWFYGISLGSGTMDDEADDWGAFPYDSYTIAELECDANEFCYGVGSITRSFTVNTDNIMMDLGTISNDCAEFGISTSATDAADGDKLVEASATSIITDAITYCAKAGLTYTIQGSLMYTDGTPVTVAGMPVQQEITDTPANDCGNTATMTFELDTSELAGKDIVVFETLLYGDETKAEHKSLSDASQTVTVIGLSTSATDAVDGDKLVEASASSQIVDNISYCLQAGSSYTIVGTLVDKATGNPLSINGNPVTETINVTPATNCGTSQMVFTLDSSKIAGKEIVVFESVYYEDELVITHEDINDTAQTINIISLDTYALDKTDEDKEVLATKDATVTDHIKYCLVAGTEYTIIGTLMNKNTGEPIVVKDALVQSSTTLTPTENCGDLYLDFDFDATGMGGTEIVVFEKAGITSPTPLADDDICLEHDVTDPDACTSYFHELISHANLDDVTQTVLVTTPEPEPEPAPKSSDTGRLTAAVDSGGGTGGDIPLVAASIVVVIAGYFGVRLFSRKRFFGKVK